MHGVPFARRKDRITAVEYRPGDDCLIGFAHKVTGYPRVTFQGRPQPVSRLILSFKIGRALRADEVAMHKCDTPGCIRPEHIVLGNDLLNMQDMVAKGRHRCLRGENHTQAKLTQAQVDEIRQRYRPVYGCIVGLAAEYGVHRETIRRIVKRERWQE